MDDAFAHCEALVRAADKDRFLTALFAPADRRRALFALYAFNVEITRACAVVHEPLAGEMRLQWWSDALRGEARGSVESNPVAAALVASVARHGLATQRLDALIEARRFDLYDAPMATLADLQSYGRDVSSTLIELAIGVLASGVAPDTDKLARHAGIGLAFAGLLKAFPIHSARGQLYVPLELLDRYDVQRDTVAAGQETTALRAALTELRREARRHLAIARGLIATAPPEIIPALLPVALAPPLLDQMEQRSYQPFVPFDIPQWRRQWLIWRAARRPARIAG
jgi:phytoene synthase